MKAGIASADNPEQLLIALEPEAASIYCRDKKMKDFTSEKGDAGVADVFARPATKYLVVDIGGNLVDRNSTQLTTFNYRVSRKYTWSLPYRGT